MTPKKGAIPALRFNLGGAPNTWHFMPAHPGLWHPQIAVPIDVVEGDTDWAQQLHDDPGCPVELVYLTATEAEAGREAYADASGESLETLLARIHRGGTTPEGVSVDPDSVALSGIERARIAAEAHGATATVPDKE